MGKPLTNDPFFYLYLLFVKVSSTIHHKTARLYVCILEWYSSVCFYFLSLSLSLSPSLSLFYSLPLSLLLCSGLQIFVKRKASGKLGCANTLGQPEQR